MARKQEVQGTAHGAVIITNKLSDGSETYDVVAYNGNKRIIIYAIDHNDALMIKRALNACSWIVIDVL